MAILRDRDEPARLLLVGGAHYRDTRIQAERLRKLADELRLGERVSFLGVRPPQEVAALMHESAVVVLPSRAESFGSVLIEALACGTPVVATSCGGPEDIVNPSVGRLIPYGDPELLAGALTAVLADGERYDPAELSAYALERFGTRTIAERYHRLYLDAVERYERASG
jgi:teichuronic acid biosynthesis glycosyltransferase TuaC